MKYISGILFIFLLLSCHKDKSDAYPFVDVLWNKAQVLHVPDNVGFTTYTIASYRFGADGIYSKTGTYPISAKWYWVEEGKRFKIDYEGLQQYNDIVTLVTSSDTLLHVTKRIEGEPDNTGNYWEIKYRP